MNRRIAVIVLITVVFTLCGVSTAQAFSMNDTEETNPVSQQQSLYNVTGSKTVITTSNRWLSNNPEELNWIVEVPGVPTEVYVIDQHAQEEISHMETVNHPAETHQEAIWSTRTKWTVYYFGPENDYESQLSTVLYNMTEEEVLRYFEARDCDMQEMKQEQEQYISGYRTIVDRAAWSEEVKVIDQEQLEEIGHYETQIVGEIGHYENKQYIPPGQGNGHFESRITMDIKIYGKVEE